MNSLNSVHRSVCLMLVLGAALTAACGSPTKPTVTTTTTTTATTTTTTAATTSTTTTTVPPLTASFTVKSLSPALRKDGTQILPAGSADVCPLVNNGGNPRLDCQLDGSTSVPAAQIQRYLWTYLFGPFQRDSDTAGPQYQMEETGCGFFAGRSSTTSGGVQFIQLIAQLRVRDSNQNLSASSVNQNVRVFPAGLCGYGF